MKAQLGFNIYFKSDLMVEENKYILLSWIGDIN